MSRDSIGVEELTDMGQLLGRDLDEDVIRRIEQRSAAHGRSTEAEHRCILEAALRGGSEASLIEASRRFREEIAQPGPDAAEIIRQAREERVRRTTP
jgi:antitoxin FitA